MISLNTVKTWFESGVAAGEAYMLTVQTRRTFALHPHYFPDAMQAHAFKDKLDRKEQHVCEAYSLVEDDMIEQLVTRATWRLPPKDAN